MMSHKAKVTPISAPVLARSNRAARAIIPIAGVLDTLPYPVLVIDAHAIVLDLNLAAEAFFETSRSLMRGQPLSHQVAADSPLYALIQHARLTGGSVAEYDLTLAMVRAGERQIRVDVACMSDLPGAVVVSFVRQPIVPQQIAHRGVARSIAAMAAMLAHEVKNPLSGIKGAAQLLDNTVSGDDKILTTLIIDEVERICALVERIDLFSAPPLHQRQPVNIHQVLEHVRRLAQNGFGKSVRFVENYDPSLPPVIGHRDPLIQLFLNLVKNAVEAAPDKGAEIIVSTAYHHGLRLSNPKTGQRVELPLLVTVQDNGAGVPADLQQNLFDLFITGKPKGTGLGLALAAKVIDDHGGVIEFDSRPGRTVFCVRLPVSWDEAES